MCLYVCIDILKKVEVTQPMTIIDHFIKTTVAVHGIHEPLPLETTKLGIEFRDPFYSIEEAMEITKESDPKAKVPFLIPLLCDKVKECDGFKTEGTFRKSAAQSELLKLKSFLKSKDWKGVCSVFDVGFEWF